MPNPRYLSVIPLDYEGHPEHSLLVTDPNWDNLVGLLAKPQHYLSDLAKQWSIKPHVPMNPHDPIVARIVPLIRNRRVWETFVNQFRDQYPRLDTDHWVPKGKPLTQNSIRTLLTEAQDAPMVTDGLFFVEYAPDTALMIITYVPPVAALAHDRAPAYSSDFTTPSLSFKTGEFSFDATCHVDLVTDRGKPAPVSQDERARFIVDMLGSRVWWANWLSGQKAYQYTYNSVIEGGMTSVPSVPNPQPPSVPYLDPSSSGDSYDNLVTITHEGLSVSQNCYTCYIQSLVNDGTNLVLGDITGKLYCSTS